VLVLDEPTNDLDLASLRMLEEAIADFEGSVLVVSHDRYFLDRICDRIVAFEEGGVFVQPGNYSYYLEKKKERDERDRQLFTAVTPPVERQIAAKTVRSRKPTYKEQREWEAMERTILIAEQRVQEIESMLNNPDFYVTRAAEASSLIAELETAKANVIRLYARWEELEKIM